jgi:hypothetical protein
MFDCRFKSIYQDAEAPCDAATSCRSQASRAATNQEIDMMDNERIEQLAADLADALAKARRDLVAAIGVAEIEYLKRTRTDLSHDEIDRLAGDFLKAVVSRAVEIQRAAGGEDATRH